MSELQLKTKEAGYAIASLGDLRDFEGKIFVKDVMETTGWKFRLVPYQKDSVCHSITNINKMRRCILSLKEKVYSL